VRRMRLLLCTALAAAILMAWEPRAAADGGPDYWAVTGIAVGFVLDIFAEPSTDAPKLGVIPSNVRKLQNLGCIHEPTYPQWLAMSEEERRQAAELRWCRIRYLGVAGWVRGRHLKED
jgi:uncharacterized protein YraI